MQQTVPQSSPNQSTWWSRNWKWFLPTVIVVPMLGCAGVFTLLISLVFGLLKGSEPFEYSLAAVQADPRVQAELGTPIEAGFFVTGTINYSGASGDADIAYQISGPTGSGTVYVVGIKSAGAWSYSVLTLELESTGDRIDLQSAGP
ncbi:MAG: cytochrome c oxidase assembly factor Coa1 family protein [Planctomycetota bacterium]